MFACVCVCFSVRRHLCFVLCIFEGVYVCVFVFVRVYMLFMYVFVYACVSFFCVCMCDFVYVFPVSVCQCVLGSMYRCELWSCICVGVCASVYEFLSMCKCVVVSLWFFCMFTCAYHSFACVYVFFPVYLCVYMWVSVMSVYELFCACANMCVCVRVAVMSCVCLRAYTCVCLSVIVCLCLCLCVSVCFECVCFDQEIILNPKAGIFGAEDLSFGLKRFYRHGFAWMTNFLPRLGYRFRRGH